MDEPWQRKRVGTASAANAVLRFVDDHRPAGAREGDRRGQAIRARADHNRVWGHVFAITLFTAFPVLDG